MSSRNVNTIFLLITKSLSMMSIYIFKILIIHFNFILCIFNLLIIFSLYTSYIS